MADLGGVFDAPLSAFLPERLTLRDERFKAAFEALRRREEATGRKLTIEAFSEAVGINERVLRKARAGRATLARFQVVEMAKRLGCAAGNIIEDPNGVHRKEREERDRREMAAWPVPLREVSSWVDFTKDLQRARISPPAYRDDVLTLAAAPAIDAFRAALTYAQRLSAANPAIAAATLKDAAEDLRFHGVRVLVGRYMGRRHSPESEHEAVQISHVMQVHLRREAEDTGHVVDRSADPMTCSDAEEIWCDDDAQIASWLAWEGKERLSLWPTETGDA